VRRRATAAALLACAALAAACGERDTPAAPEIAAPLATTDCSRLTYEGPGDAALIVPLVGPFQGAFSDHGVQNAQAIKLVLQQRGWRAGDHTVATQLCDEASAYNDVDLPKCRREAEAFAGNRSVVAVIGPTTSGCAAAMIPILNRAAGGPIALVGPGNTYLGLTRSGPGVAAGDPDRLYPTGVRSYLRLAPADDAQAAALILVARDAGARRPFLLDDGEPYGRGLAGAAAEVARRLGMSVAGEAVWDRRATSYGALAERIARTGADAVLIAGYVTSNGPRLISDLRQRLGPKVELLAPDGFNQPVTIVEGAGTRADGLTVTIASGPVRTLPSAGRRWAAEFELRTGARPCCFATQSGQAAQIVLDAIARSHGTRREVLENLRRTTVRGGLLGDFRFDRYGDTTQTTIAIYHIAEGQLWYSRSIEIPARLLTRR
jgi:branched-chain amino acid transport system substrate-binding protein